MCRLKEFKDDSNLMENEGNHRHLENLENKRSRSTTPSRISLARLMSKVKYIHNYIYICITFYL